MLTVVTGPPCSGKSSYVRQHARSGDIVVDFDLIAQTLGSPVGHGHGSRHVHVTIAAWRAAVTAAIRAHGWGHIVWIVDSQPSQRRATEYRKAGARVVQLHAEPDELRERARRDGRPRDTFDRIGQWAGPTPARSRRW